MSEYRSFSVAEAWIAACYQLVLAKAERQLFRKHRADSEIEIFRVSPLIQLVDAYSYIDKQAALKLLEHDEQINVGDGSEHLKINSFLSSNMRMQVKRNDAWEYVEILEPEDFESPVAVYYEGTDFRVQIDPKNIEHAYAKAKDLEGKILKELEARYNNPDPYCSSHVSPEGKLTLRYGEERKHHHERIQNKREFLFERSEEEKADEFVQAFKGAANLRTAESILAKLARRDEPGDGHNTPITIQTKLPSGKVIETTQATANESAKIQERNEKERAAAAKRLAEQRASLKKHDAEAAASRPQNPPVKKILVKKMSPPSGPRLRF